MHIVDLRCGDFLNIGDQEEGKWSTGGEEKVELMKIPRNSGVGLGIDYTSQAYMDRLTYSRSVQYHLSDVEERKRKNQGPNSHGQNTASL